MKNKKKFLKQVADYYVDKMRSGTNLGDYTFVFPNKRSAMFMRKYLKEEYGITGFMPRLITITSFTQDYCPMALGRPHHLLVILYKAYLTVMEARGRADQVRDFDSFVFWGNVLLSDFNDVDSYLVDPAQLFRNVKAEREISANYLTPEQIEVARLLGDNRPYETNPDVFWSHIHHNDQQDSAYAKFISLWEILYDLYLEFNRRLKLIGITYSGMQSRLACQEISSMDIADFHGNKFAFIGFYVLSESRRVIFKHLQTLGIADFFWDTASPLLHIPGNRAGDIIMPLSRNFPSPDGFQLEEIAPDDISKFEIFPVPTNIGQTKVAAHLLRDWAKDHPDAINASVATGLIMPSDKLLMPMLHSLPEQIDCFNVAMRVTYSSSPFASLLTSILRMRERSKLIHGQYHFFYKDVFEILSQPYITLLSATAVDGLRDMIVKEHLYNVSPKEICDKYPELAPIFRPILDINDVAQVRQYLIEMLGAMRQVIMHELSKSNMDATPYELALLDAYQNAIDEVFTLVQDNGIKMHQHTFFTLIGRLLGTAVFQFNGDPVKGLQILGIQDSRGLDFDNLIVMSLNERIFPPKNFNPSFIPPGLRQGYGLPTQESEEITLAYQFYRIVARASRLCFIYDSRIPDESSGEISRYLQQIMLLLPDKACLCEPKLGTRPFNSRTFRIRKDAEVMKRLNRFKPGGDLNISASALKNYITCPLKFYLQFALGLRLDDFDPEYIDASSYGTVLHLVAERLYTRLRGDASKVLILPEKISDMLNKPWLMPWLTNMAMEALNEKYYNSKYADPKHIPGEGRVLARIIATYIRNMMRVEAQGSSFVFVSGEDNGGQHCHQWHIDSDHAINFTMSIDRIDQIDDQGRALRFIDYKTGSDTNEAPSIEELFADKNYGAIFQLLTYCLAYGDIKRQQTGIDYAIKPVIYQFPTMATNGIPDIIIGKGRGAKRPINDYRQLDGDLPESLRNEFRHRLVQMIDDIFNPELDFVQTEEPKNCKYCPYASMCGRTLIPDD